MDEIERYRIEQADAWLTKVMKLVAYEKAMQAAAEAQLALADNLRSIDYTQTRVSVTPSHDAIPKAIAAHEEAADALDALAVEAAEMVARAARAIDCLDDPDEAAVLTCRYLCGMGWDEVAGRLFCSRRTAMRIRERALLHVYGLMPPGERDPIPRAI